MPGSQNCSPNSQRKSRRLNVFRVFDVYSEIKSDFKSYFGFVALASKGSFLSGTKTLIKLFAVKLAKKSLGEEMAVTWSSCRDTSDSRAFKSHALGVRLTQTNSILRSYAETIISLAFKIPCWFSEVPSFFYDII